METDKQLSMIDRIDLLIGRLIDGAIQTGCWDDVEDVDGKGGISTKRLSNLTGLNELRLLRGHLLSGTNKEQSVESKITSNLLDLIQREVVTIDDLGGKDE